MEGTKKLKSMSFHQYSWNSEVETTRISLIGWHHKTSTNHCVLQDCYYCTDRTGTTAWCPGGISSLPSLYQREITNLFLIFWLLNHEFRDAGTGQPNQTSVYCKIATTLESGINIALRLLIFLNFSKGYGLIPDSIEPILCSSISIRYKWGYAYSFSQIFQGLCLSRGYIYSRL